MTRDILARSPSASGETSKRRTSSLSRSIEIEKPWSFHKLGCPETVFQTRNSRVNDCVKEGSGGTSTRCHKKTKARHTLTGSSTTLLLPDLSVKVNDGWHYRNIKIYLQHLRAKHLYRHRLIVADASKDTAKRATPDVLPYGWYRYEIGRTDGGSQTESSGECASEACIVITGIIIRVGKFLEHRIKFKLLQHETASNVCHLQTPSESKGIVVADRCILPFLD